jgi:asparaginyl-tRNA synthetase
MSYTKIASLFADMDALAGQTVTVGGWARTIRDMKNFGFIELNDGSCMKNLQVVMETGTLENYKDIASQNVGAALIVTGTVVLTPEAKQPLELKAASIEVEGSSTPDYPLQKTAYGGISPDHPASAAPDKPFLRRIPGTERRRFCNS